MERWIYNEFKHSGVDYSDINEAENYDNRHEKFRNYKEEFDNMIDFLSLKNTKQMSIIDLGCGTGAITVLAAKKFKKVYGVDVSEIMIQQAKNKIKSENINNVEFINSGFLSYKHKAEPVDLIITKVTFHHLPDFWKQIALFNLNGMLKMKGLLYINDVVFSFEPKEYKGKIKNWISNFKTLVNEEFTKEIETHIRDEYSTFSWILEEMIRKAGFKIKKQRSKDGFISEYLCVKVKDINKSN